MIRRHVIGVAILVTALGSGCSRTTWQTDGSQPLTPSSYSVYESPTPRTVGKLRRILLVNTTSPTPEACHAAGTTALPGAGKDYLQEEKGYEVIALREPRDNLSDREKSAIAQLAAAADQTHTPVSAQTAAAVRELASLGGKFDALMLVEAGWSCHNAAPAFRWPLTAMTLGMNEVMTSKRELAPHYRATLFEAATGRPVWQSTVQHAWRIGNAEWVKEPVERQLFREIEQAVPALLTR